MAIWSTPELHAGLVVGIAATLSVATVMEVRRQLGHEKTSSEPWPFGGVLSSLAGLLALAFVGPLPWEVVLGVIGVTAAVDLAATTGQRTWVRAAVALPFAAFLATSTELPQDGWFQFTVLLAVAGGGALAGATDTDWRHEAAAPVLAAVTAACIYTAVPDTEQILAVLGVFIVMALLSWPWPLVRLGAGGAAGVVALILWAAAYGSRGRPPSFLGTVACLGLLVTLALGPRLAESVPSLLDGLGVRGRVMALAGLQAVIALFAARTAGLQDELAPAIVLSIAPVGVAIAISAAIRPSPTPSRPRRLRA